MAQDKSTIPTSRSDAVAAELRRMIQSGELAPGEHLRQAHVAERFGVSTTPVREAFTALAREGLVRQDVHRGVVVFQPSLAELTETFEIRRVLEGLAAELAAEQITADEVAALQKMLAEMEKAKPRRFVELNRTFHRQIYEAAKRERLLTLIEQHRDLSESYVHLAVRNFDQAYHDQVLADHEAIVAALAKGNRKAAGERTRKHLGRNLKRMQKLVEAESKSQPA
jgi:ribosomal protein S18